MLIKDICRKKILIQTFLEIDIVFLTLCFLTLLTGVARQEKEIKDGKGRRKTYYLQNIWLYMQKTKKYINIFKFKIEFISLWAKTKYIKVNVFYMSLIENEIF